MDKKQESKCMKELKKLNKVELEKRCQEFLGDLKDVQRAIRLEQQNRADLTLNLDSAMRSKDESTTTIIEGRLKVSERHLDYLTGREKAITEEVDVIKKILKGEDDVALNKLATLGAWFAAGSGLVLSGFGMWKSHKAFNDGSMVDKNTKSLAEKINIPNLFRMFQRK